jgi:hypothetical protein
VATISEVRRVALALPRTTEHLIRDRVKFRVGRIVYAALSRDETTMGFGYPREGREALIAAEPGRFFLPSAGDLRYHWVCVRLAAIDEPYARELVTEAWRMCVPRKVSALVPAAGTSAAHQAGGSVGQHRPGVRGQREGRAEQAQRHPRNGDGQGGQHEQDDGDEVEHCLGGHV